MSEDISVQLQDAQEKALREGDPLDEVAGEKVRIYAMSAPVVAKYPFVIFGEDQVLVEDLGCGKDYEIFSKAHVWARVDAGVSESRRQAKRIAGKVGALLPIEFELDGYVIDQADPPEILHGTDADGLTAHSVLTFRYLASSE